MSEHDLPRPGFDEYAEYYRAYVALVPEGDIIGTLVGQIDETTALLDAVTPDDERYRYADDKWSLREVVGHVLDTERVFSYRALAFSRGDPAPLPGMDQDVWTPNSGAHDRPLPDLLEEWRAVRRATVLFFASLDAAAGARKGTASGNGFTVRALAWIIAGHELHHRNILRAHYLGRG